MIRMNENFKLLQGNYLFFEINRRVREFQKIHPKIHLIKLGIGDVTLPLTPSVISGLHSAVDEMSKQETFKGYGPEGGYEFLKQNIIKFDFESRGVNLSSDEIFISTGAKEDTGNFQELFASDIKIGIPDPIYPVYSDSNVMAGRSGQFINGRYSKYVYLESTLENNFIPLVPKEDVDLIYLCFPNNPTGQVLTKSQLKNWVDYAREKKALILFDAAYEAFISDSDIPHSIFEIEGAKEVAVEFRSLSKTAGFTGTRCSYTIIPKEVKIYDSEKTPFELNSLWRRRQTTKFNETSYIIQRGAAEVFTVKGQQEIHKNIAYYMENARIIREGVEYLGFSYSGGVNSPYIWFAIPDGKTSWEFFDFLLEQAHIIGTPGSGFGKSGEGYFRLSSFGKREDVEQAVERLIKLK